MSTSTITRATGPLPAPTEVLIKEARRRGRRHHLAGITALVLVGSLTATIVVAIAATDVPTTSVASSPTRPLDAVATCPTSSLRASFDGVNSGLAGSMLTGVQLENVGATACSVQGHPSATFRDASGAVVSDITVGRMGSIVRGRTLTASPRIILRPRGRAFAVMIVPNCTGHSPGPLTSVQLVLHGVPVAGLVTRGSQPSEPYEIGGVCEPGDPGTHVAVSQLEPVRDLI